MDTRTIFIIIAILCSIAFFAYFGNADRIETGSGLNPNPVPTSQP